MQCDLMLLPSRSCPLPCLSHHDGLDPVKLWAQKKHFFPEASYKTFGHSVEKVVNTPQSLMGPAHLCPDQNACQWVRTTDRAVLYMVQLMYQIMSYACLQAGTPSFLSPSLFFCAAECNRLPLTHLWFCCSKFTVIRIVTTEVISKCHPTFRKKKKK